MPPRPSNTLICSVFLALASAGPLQCERLEPPVNFGYEKIYLKYTYGAKIWYCLEMVTTANLPCPIYTICAVNELDRDVTFFIACMNLEEC